MFLVQNDILFIERFHSEKVGGIVTISVKNFAWTFVE